MENTSLSAKHLSFSYHGAEGEQDRAVFTDLDLAIEQGSFVAIIGRNGCGKSTFAKHMNAILLPCGGTVTAYGMDTQDESKLLAIRKCVGMVFQNPDNQIVTNVAEEDVAFAPENLGVPPEEIRKRVDDALKATGMYHFRKQAPDYLSGGQKQRLAIAGVLAMQPKCIVLDEPTAMLDPKGRREVLETIQKMNRSLHMTVVLITHHMEEAAMADRVVVLSDGKVLMDGTPKAVFLKTQELRDADLEAPKTTQLLEALNCSGFSLPTDALSVHECAQALYDALKA